MSLQEVIQYICKRPFLKRKSKYRIFVILFEIEKIANVAQLVEHDLAKVGVASSNLVIRSEGHS